MRLRWFRPPSSQHCYCYLGRKRHTHKKANLRTTWKWQSQNSAWGESGSIIISPTASLAKTWMSFCLDQQLIGLFFLLVSRQHPLHLTDDSQKGSGFMWGFFPGDKLKASICLHTQGSPVRRWAARPHPGLAPHPARRAASSRLDCAQRLQPHIHYGKEGP